MKCPECMREGKRSKVYPGTGVVTLAYNPPFWDEDGKLHSHDPNVSSFDYHCSNGHKWVQKEITRCWCGWPETEPENKFDDDVVMVGTFADKE